MGVDIYSFAEVRQDGRWKAAGEAREPFEFRSYAVYGFLADVRNYSHSPVIAEPRGLPEDVDLHGDDLAYWLESYHSASWLTLAELQAYDYEQVFWGRRITRGNNGAALAEEGEGEHLTLRDFLGESYFRELDQLAKLGDPEDVRVVFAFG
jgi:hypothetical protein